MIRLAILCSMFFAFAGSASATGSFTLAGCECTPGSQTVVLGWRGTQPGAALQVRRDGAVIYTGSNPQAPPYNAYLNNQPTGEHGYTACTGAYGITGFIPLACSSNTVTINVT